MYNGWPNIQSWIVFKWFSCNDDIYNKLQIMAGEYQEMLPKLLKELVEESKPIKYGLYSELLDFVLDDVNWEAVASALQERERNGKF